MRNVLAATVICLFVLVSCQTEKKNRPDTLYFNGNIYTVNDSMPWASVVMLKEGRIIAVGDSSLFSKFDTTGVEKTDLKGHFMMPGFIEGHGHFLAFGESLQNLNFADAKEWEDVIAKVATKAAETPIGTWIVGRGWHQEKWDKLPLDAVEGYPRHSSLSALVKDHPVVLMHASGHALFANSKAMEIAGLSKESAEIKGGRMLRDPLGGLTGVFEENSMGPIMAAMKASMDKRPKAQVETDLFQAFQKAEQACFAAGVTSFQDAGTSVEKLEYFKKWANDQQMQIRMWAMIRDSLFKTQRVAAQYPIIDAGDHHLTIRAIKSEIDGALGSYGAWLLSDYSDKPGFAGQNTTEVDTVKAFGQVALDRGLQLCVHAIGDRGNREILYMMRDLFGANPDKKDLRWRMEHTQHIDPVDIPIFKSCGVIASMQAIHCTSDAPFVVARLGEERARTGAYAWRSLWDAGVLVTNGTDVPVESVNPLASYYASVTRKYPGRAGAFFPEQSLSRAEGIMAYTLHNAIAGFEEKDKGSIEVGKLADFVILSEDLIRCSEEKLLKTKVIATIIGGKQVFPKK